MNIQKNLREKADRLESHPTINLHEVVLLLRQAANKIDEQEKRLIDYSWKVNPDRMGGQFSDEEINRKWDEWS